MRARAGLLWASCAAAFVAGAPRVGAQAAGRPQAVASAQSAAALMETAAARYEHAASVCSDFTQRLTVPLLGQDQTGRGRFCSQRPDRFALRFTEPAGDLVVGDGTWVWAYYPSMDAKQVLRISAARAPGGFDFYREYFEGWAHKYQVTPEGPETVAGRATQRLRLVPRAGTSYQAVVVWVEADGVLRQIRVEEENGSVRTVTLTSADMGATPPAAWFTFTPPRGAQIIGG
ncbi:MAG TPA: outer membrane lipoprotein carrier protein LolA [Longimicrobiales bacterium]|nr:outer membrane lipoprotein carrier protein LolA [Longimicrobiales bacterium]